MAAATAARKAVVQQSNSAGSNIGATAEGLGGGAGSAANVVAEAEGTGQLAFLRSGLEQLDAEIASLQQSLA